MTRIFVSAALLCVFSCSHVPPSKSELGRVTRPVFVAQVDKSAGPYCDVFTADSSYDARLKQLSRAEGNRRLREKIASVTTPFEIGESLRSETYLRLPRVQPWTSTVDPGEVARAMESLLVVDGEAGALDYDRLKPLNADAVVELVIERFGMSSKNGKAGVFVEGYGRMFRVNGGLLWKRSFRADQVRNGENSLDPFDVAKQPHIFREELMKATAAVGTLFATDLGVGFESVESPSKTQSSTQSNGLE